MDAPYKIGSHVSGLIENGINESIKGIKPDSAGPFEGVRLKIQQFDNYHHLGESVTFNKNIYSAPYNAQDVHYADALCLWAT